ncbi:bis(5'-adenosyl)-triphosphatase isoform X1 [Phyllopteryx taeniolatus]|uniref:bis(5'-adenosyl)-triphosphatase isoform X1 n=1 Tax=Phyllopteryx taeniolatus TaxID=161469 RepID=UPI002AD37CD9|nr:bis(5'-adenosyl)-triphosphatase isoform X1 [Phyllopteryx taeniolatus]
MNALKRAGTKVTKNTISNIMPPGTQILQCQTCTPAVPDVPACKMPPTSVVASVTRSLVLSLFLCFLWFSSVFGDLTRLTYTRGDLLTIKESTPDFLSPTFEYPLSFFPELLTGAASAVFGAWRRKRRHRGKRAGIQVKLRKRGHRLAFPSIHLANVCSLPNKMDELHLLLKTSKDFGRSAAMCFTETWLCDAVPDGGIMLPGFHIHRADRDMESSGKTKGGGICLYINEKWCTDVTVLSTHCSPHLESLFLNCKPFYSPREFASFILAGVYIPPQANTNAALLTLADQVNEIEKKHPDSPLIILGDFNKAKLNHELPKYKQHIDCPTRENNTLDHCYTTVKNAYRAIPRAALGSSDHCLIHLIPTYRQELKCAKPTVKTVKKWTNEAKMELQSCLDCTDWSVFENSAGSLDEYTDTVTSYISFCEEVCVPTKSFRTFNNNKPWFTAKLKQLRQAK